MDFSQKVILNAGQISEADFTDLRGHGLKDEEIFNVVLACSARSFFSKTLDAVNARPDDVYLELEPELIRLFTKGRPFP